MAKWRRTKGESDRKRLCGPAQVLLVILSPSTALSSDPSLVHSKWPASYHAAPSCRSLSFWGASVRTRESAATPVDPTWHCAGMVIIVVINPLLCRRQSHARPHSEYESEARQGTQLWRFSGERRPQPRLSGERCPQPRLASTLPLDFVISPRFVSS
jgi:hypothetical protein